MRGDANKSFDANKKQFSESHSDLLTRHSTLFHPAPGLDVSIPVRTRKFSILGTFFTTLDYCRRVFSCVCFFCCAVMEGGQRSGMGGTVFREVVWRRRCQQSTSLVSRYQPWAWLDRMFSSGISRGCFRRALGPSPAGDDFYSDREHC